jgi:DNA-binding HxlR family transcriptional regulator
MSTPTAPKQNTKRKTHLTLGERAAYRSLEDVIGCKWSAAVVGAIGRGVHRPGQLERFIPGISTKVLTERLRKLLAYGLITRTEFRGLPLHVEYKLTPAGRKLARVIDQLRTIESELANAVRAGAQVVRGAKP